MISTHDIHPPLDESMLKLHIDDRSVDLVPRPSLKEAVDTFRQAVVPLGHDYSHDISSLLDHFEEAIRQIVKTNFEEKYSHGFVSIPDIAMECLKESVSFGKLDPQSYCLKRQSEDPNWAFRFDSTGLGMRSAKASTELDRWGYMRARITEMEFKWTAFWRQVVRRLPLPPTLFAIQENTESKWNYRDLPRYLFRVCDVNSSGINTSRVVASPQSEFGNPEDSATDILSLPGGQARRLLYNHLAKCSESQTRKSIDNFMSWSSSLMFVIQYAMWRSETLDTPASDLQICMVDTRDFPRGQFARDMWLIRHYRHSVLTEPQQEFFDFRLGNPDHDNGEFLSQGMVNLRNKACFFSLQDLMSAGIDTLHPMFKGGPYYGVQWTDRMLDLRSFCNWETYLEEKDFWKAQEIARKVFTKFDVMDIALLLLSFRNYKFKWEIPDRFVWAGDGVAEPADVHRYKRWTALWEASRESLKQPESLREFFIWNEDYDITEKNTW
ncbi:hypothetical protein HG530_014652 [Fusarium avenaceum]|nr:hypothetical protein HG530_014652 [Fusarium avenaceum]